MSKVQKRLDTTNLSYVDKHDTCACVTIPAEVCVAVVDNMFDLCLTFSIVFASARTAIDNYS